MNRRYKKGRDFEYKIKHSLERRGYRCLRSAGSHGEYDLVAYKDNTFLFIQCKLNKKSKIIKFVPNGKAYFLLIGNKREMFKLLKVLNNNGHE